MLAYYDWLDKWSPWQLKSRIKLLEEAIEYNKDHIKQAHAQLIAKKRNVSKAIEILENVHPNCEYRLRRVFHNIYGPNTKNLIPQSPMLSSISKNRKKDKSD
jgi:hypothetical protein